MTKNLNNKKHQSFKQRHDQIKLHSKNIIQSKMQKKEGV